MRLAPPVLNAEPHPPLRLWAPFRDRPVVRYLNDTLPKSILVYHLLVTGFITGVLDATTYADFGVFTSNQTGNSVLLGVGAFDLVHVNLIDVATSLSSFLVTLAICGQIAIRIEPGGGRCRWWALLSSFYQALTVLLVAILIYTDVIEVDGRWSYLIILILASSSGAQVAMAKQFSIPEIPTAMLTSPIADVLTDRHFFSLSFSDPANIPRNRRLSYIFILLLGAFIGSAIHRHGGTKTVLLLSGCLKLAVAATLFFVPYSSNPDDFPLADHASLDFAGCSEPAADPAEEWRGPSARRQKV